MDRDAATDDWTCRRGCASPPRGRRPAAARLAPARRLVARPARLRIGRRSHRRDPAARGHRPRAWTPCSAPSGVRSAPAEGTARWLGRLRPPGCRDRRVRGRGPAGHGNGQRAATAWLRRSAAGHVLRCGPGLLRSFSTGDTVSRIVGGTVDAGTAPASAVMAVTAVIAAVRQRARPRPDRPLAGGRLRARGSPRSPWSCARSSATPPMSAPSYQQAQGAIAARLLDALAGARTIAAAGTRDRGTAADAGAAGRTARRGDATWRIQARAAAQGMVIVPILQVIVLAVAGFELASARITPGELVAASQYAVIAVGVGASIGQVNRLGRARGGARRAAGVARPGAPGIRRGRPWTWSWTAVVSPA